MLPYLQTTGIGASNRSLAAKLVGAVEIAIGVLVVLPNTRVIGVIAAVTALLIYLVLMARQLWLGKKDSGLWLCRAAG